MNFPLTTALLAAYELIDSSIRCDVAEVIAAVACGAARVELGNTVATGPAGIFPCREAAEKLAVMAIVSGLRELRLTNAAQIRRVGS